SDGEREAPHQPACARDRLREQRLELLLGFLPSQRRDVAAGVEADREHKEQEVEPERSRRRRDRGAADLAELLAQVLRDVRGGEAREKEAEAEREEADPREPYEQVAAAQAERQCRWREQQP